MEHMSNSGLLRPPFIPLTDFNNRILSNRTKKEVLTNLYYLHLIQLLTRQTDQQMEQLSDLKGQSPESSAKMPTSGLLPSPSIHWRYRGGGPMCQPDTQKQQSPALALVRLSISEEGPHATAKVQDSKVPYKKVGLAESWGRKSKTTTKHENGGLWGRAPLRGTQQECVNNLKGILE